MSIAFQTISCELGWILGARTERGLRAVFWGGDKQFLIDSLRHHFPEAQSTQDISFMSTMEKLIQCTESAYVYDEPLDMQGTLFQQKVWAVLQSIPRGKTLSYADVAKRIGIPRAYRAVARACATNLLAIVIPCHRVMGQRGLGGYRWGIERKAALLRQEQVIRFP